MAVQGVILDVDGTLILSNDAHAWVRAFAGFDYEIAFDQVRPLIRMGRDRIIPKLFPGLNKEEGDGKAVSDRRKEIVINHFGPQLQPAPGSRELVQRMQQAGLKLVIASSSSQAQ